MELIKRIIQDFIIITNEMSVYLLLGFLLAGVLKVFFTKSLIHRFSKPSLKSVILASVFGIPLPLCSCGVIPTGVSLYHNGASKGATVSFLTSTPQTGIDSIIISSSILGLPFAIIRVIVAFFTGIISGIIVNFSDKNVTLNSQKYVANDFVENTQYKSKFVYIFKYAFVDFFKDIAKWLLIGLIISAIISAILPDNFFTMYADNKIINLFAVLLASIPMYVCATGSIPITALLMMKGMSAGLAFIFLMGGPATNAATITLISKVLGRKTLIIYILSIIINAIIFGLIIDNFLPESWFTILNFQELKEHSFIPHFIKIISSIILFLLLLNTLYLNYKSKSIIKHSTDNKFVLDIEGMICSKCKSNVEKSLSTLPNIKKVDANVKTKKIYIESTDYNLNDIKKTVEELGYKIVDKL